MADIDLITANKKFLYILSFSWIIIAIVAIFSWQWGFFAVYENFPWKYSSFRYLFSLILLMACFSQVWLVKSFFEQIETNLLIRGRTSDTAKDLLDTQAIGMKMLIAQRKLWLILSAAPIGFQIMNCLINRELVHHSQALKNQLGSKIRVVKKKNYWVWILAYMLTEGLFGIYSIYRNMKDASDYIKIYKSLVSNLPDG